MNISSNVCSNSKIKIENLNKERLSQYNPAITRVFNEVIGDAVVPEMSLTAHKQLVASIVQFNSPLYLPIYPNFNRANPCEVYLSTQNWIFESRNLKFPGAEQDIAKNSFSKEFFAFGNISLEEAPIIFIGDSNHINKTLTKKMMDLVTTIVKEGDIVMLEGLSQGVEIEASFMDKKFTIRGWEDRKVLKQLAKDIKEGIIKDEIITETRNKILTSFINDLANKHKKRMIVVCGEAHISKDVIDNLNDKHYLSLLTRYAIFNNESKIIKKAQKYLVEGIKEENIHVNVMKSLGVSFTSRVFHSEEDVQDSVNNSGFATRLKKELEKGNPELIKMLEQVLTQNPELLKK